MQSNRSIEAQAEFDSFDLTLSPNDQSVAGTRLRANHRPEPLPDSACREPHATEIQRRSDS